MDSVEPTLEEKEEYKEKTVYDEEEDKEKETMISNSKEKINKLLYYKQYHESLRLLLSVLENLDEKEKSELIYYYNKKFK